jgi:hypothetical protein
MQGLELWVMEHLGHQEVTLLAEVGIVALEAFHEGRKVFSWADNLRAPRSKREFEMVSHWKMEGYIGWATAFPQGHHFRDLLQSDFRSPSPVSAGKNALQSVYH